jgi:hypothetical protein
MVRSIVTTQVGVWMGSLTGDVLVRVNVSMARSEDPLPREDASAAVGGETVIAALRAENALFRSEITLLVVRIAEPEGRLGLSSSNSGKPPSSSLARRRPGTG